MKVTVTMGNSVKIKCPFHKEKVASCVIIGDKFHCYGCGKSGTVDELNKKIEDVAKGEG